jgi:hypothetical protein
VVDNGSSHRGAASIKRLRKAHPNAIMVHTPTRFSFSADANAVAVQGDGKIVVVGSTGIDSSTSGFAVARYN